jgi:hypothetical protein
MDQHFDPRELDNVPIPDEEEMDSESKPYGNHVVLVSIPLATAVRAERFLQETQGVSLQQALRRLTGKIAYQLWWPDPNDRLTGHVNPSSCTSTTVITATPKEKINV